MFKLVLCIPSMFRAAREYRAARRDARSAYINKVMAKFLVHNTSSKHTQLRQPTNDIIS